MAALGRGGGGGGGKFTKSGNHYLDENVQGSLCGRGLGLGDMKL